MYPCPPAARTPAVAPRLLGLSVGVTDELLDRSVCCAASRLVTCPGPFRDDRLLYSGPFKTAIEENPAGRFMIRARTRVVKRHPKVSGSAPAGLLFHCASM
jgi:hypothetical protein